MSRPDVDSISEAGELATRRATSIMAGPARQRVLGEAVNDHEFALRAPAETREAATCTNTLPGPTSSTTPALQYPSGSGWSSLRNTAYSVGADPLGAHLVEHLLDPVGAGQGLAEQ